MSSNSKYLPPEWIDEIPVRPSASKAVVVSIASAMLSLLGLAMWHYGTPALMTLLLRNGAVASALGEAGLILSFIICFHAFALIGASCLVAGVLSVLRIGLTYRILRATLLTIYPAVLIYAWLVWKAVFIIVNNELSYENSSYDRVTGLILWWKLCWPALAIGLYAFWLHAMLSSRSVFAAFTSRDGEPMEGDRILEDWRTHGYDPRARKSLYSSIVTHIFVIVIIPFLLSLYGCVEPYQVPQGSGEPQITVVVKKVKKKKKKKRLSLRKNSAFIYEIPDIFEETDVDKEMDQKTQETYVANANPGKIGQGGGKKGGWPEGMKDAKVRFIRLKHGGTGWDDGMHKSQADVNFLYHFQKATGFKTKRKGESHSIALLSKYPDDGFPPFVFLTGNSHMGRTSNQDKTILREYCLKGGMLIADAGSSTFDRSFRSFVSQVFPGKQLIDISDDDVIYQQPTRFPNGAPSFWHHGGSRAMGIKHEGRWVVFYHPGDMNDAWKSAGYSDVTPLMRKQAMNLGINLVYYAFNQWNDAVRKLRK